MITLKEFMKDKKLGEVNIAIDSYHWFKPMFIHNSIYYGFYKDGPSSQHKLNLIMSWQVYGEPKPKVMRAQYQVMYKTATIPFIGECLYKDDSEFIDRNSLQYISWFKRLEEQECES